MQKLERSIEQAGYSKKEWTERPETLGRKHRISQTFENSRILLEPFKKFLYHCRLENTGGKSTRACDADRDSVEKEI